MKKFYTKRFSLICAFAASALLLGGGGGGGVQRG